MAERYAPSLLLTPTTTAYDRRCQWESIVFIGNIYGRD